MGKNLGNEYRDQSSTYAYGFEEGWFDAAGGTTNPDDEGCWKSSCGSQPHMEASSKLRNEAYVKGYRDAMAHLRIDQGVE